MLPALAVTPPDALVIVPPSALEVFAEKTALLPLVATVLPPSAVLVPVEELALAAPTVVTAAPCSKRNLDPVAKAAGIKVMDIAEVLAG